MFEKENWRTEKIIEGLSRIPTTQAHFVVVMAVLGAIMALIGFFQLEPTLKESLDKVPASLLLMLLGLVGFMLFLPMPYIIYLAKELQKTKAEVDELAEELRNTKARVDELASKEI